MKLLNISVKPSESSAASPAPLVTLAWVDLARGALRWDLYGRLGWLEIKRRYRRTVIGPFWSALSLAIMVGALGTVGVGLWNQSGADYVPFLAAGMVIWLMISLIMTESCSLFIAGKSLFRQVRIDFSILAYALVWRNFLVFLHNLTVYAIVVVLLAPHLISPTIILAVPGIALVLVNGIWIALLLGLFCLRFRDLQQLINSIMQICMFITPIFWPPESLSGVTYTIFVTYNPLYHLIDVVRAPLIDRIPSGETYLAVLIVTVLGWLATYGVFRQFRKRIAYWA